MEQIDAVLDGLRRVVLRATKDYVFDADLDFTIEREKGEVRVFITPNKFGLHGGTIVVRVARED